MKVRKSYPTLHSLETHKKLHTNIVNNKINKIGK